jgi:hypothetical protein
MRCFNAIVASLLLFIVAVAPVSAQAPDSLSFQGFVTDPGGIPIDTPGVTVIFTLYEGSAPVWSETQPSIAIVGGVFNVLLGSVMPLDTVRFNRPLSLGIKVGDDSEISPRTALAAAAYAKALPGLHTFFREDLNLNKSHNVVGGGPNNIIAVDVVGATIGGGGGIAFGTSSPNQVLEDFGTVAGGVLNTASDWFAAVGGGRNNTASAFYTTVGGGSSNTASEREATVGGGEQNSASGAWATVGGGNSNTASNSYAIVGGGMSNIASGQYATVGGGFVNTASETFATVGGGQYHAANGFSATVGGGDQNTASGSRSTVGGGRVNLASGTFSTVPGGSWNHARGNNSLAAGYRARAIHEGSFVWNDRSVTTLNDSLLSTAANQFLIRAAGGVGIGTNTPITQFHVVRSVNGAAAPVNHVALIDNISTGSGADVLALRIGRSDNPAGTNAFLSFIYNNGTGAGHIQGDGTGGVTLASSGADFAEYLPHLDPNETLEPGEVVGIFSGKISHRTGGADQVMVVSTAPIVVGNRTALNEDSDEGFSRVAFIGQAPVKVHGIVESGDFLLPSGLSDGFAVAISPIDITPDQIGTVFATAWESSGTSNGNTINAAIGIDQSGASAHAIRALHAQGRLREQQIISMMERLAVLEASIIN